MYERVAKLINRINLSCLGVTFIMALKKDNIYSDPKDTTRTRLYIQLYYYCHCTKTGIFGLQKGRKWYLSDFMTDDEIVKSIYGAFEMAVKHEILEGFKVDGKSLFNPHVDFEELLKVCDKEVTRVHIPTYSEGDFE